MSASELRCENNGAVEGPLPYVHWKSFIGAMVSDFCVNGSTNDRGKIFGVRFVSGGRGLIGTMRAQVSFLVN
jgi:hypothetical protein